MDPIFAVIASGATVSGNVDLRQRQLQAIAVPVINSGDTAIQGNYDTTSANFVRVLDVRGQQGSGDLRFPTLAGSRMVLWPTMMPSPAYARVEVIGITQTDNRTFVLLTTPRR